MSLLWVAMCCHGGDLSVGLQEAGGAVCTGARWEEWVGKPVELEDMELITFGCFCMMT